jgi:nitrate/nitrite transporter NarK
MYDFVLIFQVVIVYAICFGVIIGISSLITKYITNHHKTNKINVKYEYDGIHIAYNRR